VHTREWKLVPLIAVVATTAHPVAVARVLLRQQQARTGTVTSAADDSYPDDDDDDDDDDALLTAAVPVIVDNEAAYYLLPPPPVDKHRRGAAIPPTTTTGGGGYGITRSCPPTVHKDFGWSAEEGKIETVIAGASRASSSSRIVATGQGDRHCRGLTHSEVRAYLEMANWDVDVALGSIREDFGTYYYGGEKFDRGTHVRACARMDETFDLHLLCSDPWNLEGMGSVFILYLLGWSDDKAYRHIAMYKKVGGDFHSGNEKERRETSVIIPTCLQYSMVLPLGSASHCRRAARHGRRAACRPAAPCHRHAARCRASCRPSPSPCRLSPCCLLPSKCRPLPSLCRRLSCVVPPVALLPLAGSCG
jgi:hypothetical protein